MEPKDKRVMEEFKERKRKQIIAVVPAIFAIFIVIMLDEKKSGTVLGMTASAAMPLAVVVIFGVLIFSLMNWRCPSCNGYLGKGINPRFCQRCGAQLQD